MLEQWCMYGVRVWDYLGIGLDLSHRHVFNELFRHFEMGHPISGNHDG